jgi:chemotaxis protein MotB
MQKSSVKELALKTRRRYRRSADVDDWLMTYADMVTLLLCFFAIFLSVSIPKKEKFEQAAAEVRNQFGSTVATVPHSMPPRNFSIDDDDVTYGGLPSIVDGYDENRATKEDRTGDRLTTFEMNAASFFSSGASTLSDEGKRILGGEMFKTLTSDEFKDFIITVEGHTDDNPINTLQFPSNWELSTARAASVVRYYLELGIPASRLRAAGYSDTYPKVPNRDANGQPIPANQALNRRVIIKLEKVDRE